MLTDKELSVIVQAWGNETTQRNIVDLCRDVARAQEAAERERWETKVKDAFLEGYISKSTYNDVELTGVEEEWEKAKAGLLK